MKLQNLARNKRDFEMKCIHGKAKDAGV